MIIVDTTPEHFKQIELQDAQLSHAEIMSNYDFTDLLSHTNFTFINDEKIIAICSIVKLHNHRYMLCSFISKYAYKYMYGLTLSIKDYINKMQDCRIETTVSPDFKQAIRWVEILGFKKEGFMECFAEDGSDQIMYSLIKRSI